MFNWPITPWWCRELVCRSQWPGAPFRHSPRRLCRWAWHAGYGIIRENVCRRREQPAGHRFRWYVCCRLENRCSMTIMSALCRQLQLWGCPCTSMPSWDPSSEASWSQNNPCSVPHGRLTRMHSQGNASESRFTMRYREDGRMLDMAALIVVAIMTLVDVPLDGSRPKGAGFQISTSASLCVSEELTGHGSRLAPFG